MRDTDPIIVSTTLRCLADLVPILGPEVVVGTNRTKIFSDGSPGKKSGDCHLPQGKTLQSKTYSPAPVMGDMVIKIEDNGFANGDDWDDWNDGDIEETSDNNESRVEETTKEYHDDSNIRTPEMFKESPVKDISSDFTSNVDKMIKNIEDLDIMKLDIKVNKAKTDKVEDVDFFADMKPVIVKGSTALEKFEEKLARGAESPAKAAIAVEKFAAPDDDAEADWGEEDLDWGN